MLLLFLFFQQGIPDVKVEASPAGGSIVHLVSSLVNSFNLGPLISNFRKT